MIFEVEKGFWESRPLPHRTKAEAQPSLEPVNFAVILAASLLGMTASVYIHKTPDATAGSRVGRVGKVKKPV